MELNIYCVLDCPHFSAFSGVIEALFPENVVDILEQKSVYISEGPIFECSIENVLADNDCYLSANYTGSLEDFNKLVLEMARLLSEKRVKYVLDYEVVDGHP